MWRVLRNSSQCLPLLRLHRSLSLSLLPAASTHVHKHQKALYLCWNTAQRKFLTLSNFESGMERVWQQHASAWGRRAGIQGIQKYRAKAVAFEEGERKESPCGENRAGCCEWVDLWTLSSVCLPVSLLVCSPRAPACMPLCSLPYLFLGGKSMALMLFIIPEIHLVR